MTGSEYRAAREALGLTQMQSAVQLGVTVGTIQRRESGRVPVTDRARREIVRLIESLGGASPAQTAPRRENPDTTVTGVEGSILAVLAPDGSFIDEIAARCRLSISEVLGALTMMELKGIVRQFSGKRFAPR